MGLFQSGSIQGSRDYQIKEVKRPLTRNDLSDAIAAKIHSLYLPYINENISEKNNDKILCEVEKILKKVQEDARGPKTQYGKK